MLFMMLMTLYQSPQTLQREYPPGSVMQYLCEVVQDETHTLHSVTANLNLADEASQLKSEFVDPTYTRTQGSYQLNFVL